MTTRSELSRASESVRVLDPRSRHTPGGGSAREPTITFRAGDALLAHLREQVHQVHAYDLLVREDAPDSVHKMRVATRRLRSALTTFEPLVDPGVVRALGKELKWLAQELGAARDAEVMRDRVSTALEGQGEEAAAAVVRADLDDAIAFANAMEAVQEALGEYQDSVFTRERLRDLARHTSGTGAAFLYGRLFALEEAGTAKSQRHSDAAWKAAASKPLHRWLR